MCYKTYQATVDYKCTNGKLSGSYCIIDKSTMANATYKSPTNYQYNGSLCESKKVSFTYNPANYENYSETSKSSIYNTFQNNCSNGNGTIVNTNGVYYCYTSVTKVPTITYDCNGKEGTLAGNGCIKFDTEAALKFPSCPDGGYLVPNAKWACKEDIKATEK